MEVRKKTNYTCIPNHIIDQLYLINLPSYEHRMLFYLSRKTYGWHEETTLKTLSEISDEVRIDRRLVHRSLKSLFQKNIIIKIKTKNRIRYGIQDDVEKWNPSGKMSSEKTAESVIKTDDKVSSKQMTKPLSEEMTKPQSYHYIKENKKNTEKVLLKFQEFWKAYPVKINRKKTQDFFMNLNPDDTLFDKIMKSIEAKKQSDAWQNKKFIKHPFNFLRDENYNDEEIKPVVSQSRIKSENEITNDVFFEGVNIFRKYGRNAFLKYAHEKGMKKEDIERIINPVKIKRKKPLNKIPNQNNMINNKIKQWSRNIADLANITHLNPAPVNHFAGATTG